MTISVQHLSVDSGRRRIVSDVCLEVPNGAFVGLLGPNGSGKSTILKTISRINRPAAGAVLIDGTSLDEPTNHLDVRHQSEVLDIVTNQGVTVLAALHDLGVAALYRNQVYLLANGKIQHSGTPADVITAENVMAVYRADVLVVPHPETGTPQPLPRRPATQRKRMQA